jgi:hypothetical protein
VKVKGPSPSAMASFSFVSANSSSSSSFSVLRPREVVDLPFLQARYISGVPRGRRETRTWWPCPFQEPSQTPPTSLQIRGLAWPIPSRKYTGIYCDAHGPTLRSQKCRNRSVCPSK